MFFVVFENVRSEGRKCSGMWAFRANSTHIPPSFISVTLRRPARPASPESVLVGEVPHAFDGRAAVLGFVIFVEHCDEGLVLVELCAGLLQGRLVVWRVSVAPSYMWRKKMR